MTPEPPPGPDPAEGPLDPFDDDVPLAAGTHDDDLLRTPSAPSRLLSSFIDLMSAYLVINILDAIVIVAAVHPGKKITPTQQREELVAFVVAALLVAAGFVVLERLTGRSVGRRLLRLRLVSKDGTRPTLGQLSLRYLVIVLFTVFVVGLFGPLLGSLIVLVALGSAGMQPMRRNAFDMVTGTRVVSDAG